MKLFVKKTVGVWCLNPIFAIGLETKPLQENITNDYVVLLFLFGFGFGDQTQIGKYYNLCTDSYNYLSAVSSTGFSASICSRISSGRRPARRSV